MDSKQTAAGHPDTAPAPCGHDSVREFYDEVYYRDAEAVITPSAHYRRLVRRLGLAPGQSLLDVACGAAQWLLAARQADMRVAGIDISAKAVEIGARVIPDADLRCGVAEHLPWPDDSFDVVTCLGSLEHFVDKPQALREMVRVAKPRAQVLILVPNAGFLTRRLGLFKGTQQADVIEEVKTLPEWQALFGSSGLEVVDCWRDLHVLSADWIRRGPRYAWPLRLVQALLLAVWPRSWQYQVYHLCRLSTSSHTNAAYG
jgi:SAM-dependent methyltransferase